MYISAVMHLSEYMASKSLSDDQVAIAIKRSRATVSRIRRKKVRPDWDTIEALREFSDGIVTADDMLALLAGELSGLAETAIRGRHHERAMRHSGD